MTISDQNKKFVKSLIDYYTSEPQAYSEIVQAYSPKSELSETTVGFVIGMIYSGFLRAYSDQGLEIKSDDIDEFNSVVRDNITKIRNAFSKTGLLETKNS